MTRAPHPSLPTARQLDVLRVIARLTREHGYPPTVTEMARELGVWRNATVDVLRALERRGLVQSAYQGCRPGQGGKRGQRARSMTVTPAGRLWVLEQYATSELDQGART